MVQTLNESKGDKALEDSYKEISTVTLWSLDPVCAQL